MATIAPNVRPAVAHSRYATPQEKEIVERVEACVQSWELGIGPDWRDRCNRFYQQYRGFRKWRDAWLRTGPNDKDEALRDGKKTWGSQLHIPLSFRTIETITPAAISQRPRLLILPQRERWAENVANWRLLIDMQQDQIDIDLPFQAVFRSGRIYGLGLGKSLWRKQYAKRRRAQERTFAGKVMTGSVFKRAYELGPVKAECVFDDPDFEDVDVFDFMWDPFASDIRSCGWVVHRVWLGLEGCMQRIESGLWDTPTVKGMVENGRVEEDLRALGSGVKYDEVWSDRMTASGFSSFNLTTRGEQIHEVHEYHNGDDVFTVLDRSLLVQGWNGSQTTENPCVGSIPFTAYRPTPLQRQFVGIGDLEPLEHLQREIDTLRSQLRDVATLALCAGYVYDDNAIDEEDLVFGPAAAIRVTNAARVQDAIMPIPVKDITSGAVEQEKTIRADTDAVSGINDALNPQEGSPAGTATEAQLVQASLSRRIELSSRRFEIEVVRQVCRAWMHLDQRMILTDRARMVPEEGLSYEEAAQEGRWREVKLGPGELMGDFLIKPEGGSMAARNVPQDRQDAGQIMSMFGQHPNIDPRRPLERALKLMGVDDPASWMRQDAPPVPPLALEMLQQAGVDPELIRYAVASAQQAQPQLGSGDQGPSVGMVDQAMGAGVAA